MYHEPGNLTNPATGQTFVNKSSDAFPGEGPCGGPPTGFGGCTLSMVFWPEFVEYRGCVIVDWKFSQDNVDIWLTELAGDTSAVEQIVNHVHLWEQSAATWLANRIGSMWQNRLREAFPDRSFVVTVSNEPTDYGPTITFKSAVADDGRSTSIR